MSVSASTPASIFFKKSDNTSVKAEARCEHGLTFDKKNQIEILRKLMFLTFRFLAEVLFIYRQSNNLTI